MSSEATTNPITAQATFDKLITRAFTNLPRLTGIDGVLSTMIDGTDQKADVWAAGQWVSPATTLYEDIQATVTSVANAHHEFALFIDSSLSGSVPFSPQLIAQSLAQMKIFDHQLQRAEVLCDHLPAAAMCCALARNKMEHLTYKCSVDLQTTTTYIGAHLVKPQTLRPQPVEAVDRNSSQGDRPAG